MKVKESRHYGWRKRRWLGKDGEGERGEKKRARQPGVPQDLTENLDIEGKTNRGS